MINFEWVCPTRIIFGKKTLKKELENLLNNIQIKSCFTMDKEVLKKTGLYDKVVKSLKKMQMLSLLSLEAYSLILD